jgi:hypothetical protein
MRCQFRIATIFTVPGNCARMVHQAPENGPRARGVNDLGDISDRRPGAAGREWPLATCVSRHQVLLHLVFPGDIGRRQAAAAFEAAPALLLLPFRAEIGGNPVHRGAGVTVDVGRNSAWSSRHGIQWLPP